MYPEWFIDGPWHGEDKLKKCPHLQGVIRCALPRPFDARSLLDTEPVPSGADLAFDEYTYVPKWVDVFGERICVWVSEMNAGMVSRESYPDWVAMLGQLIMSPHRTDGTHNNYDVGGMARIHRDRWDIDHEIRRAVYVESSQLQQRIRRLEDENRRLRTGAVLDMSPTAQNDRYRLVHVDRSAAIIEMMYEQQEHSYVRLDNIIVFFDEGDSENSPSWVATAQGPNESPSTGYGTTKKAAMVALLADALGVYARMVDIGERMK